MLEDTWIGRGSGVVPREDTAWNSRAGSCADERRYRYVHAEPGAAPVGRMIGAQTALETRMLLRNGEQLLLTVVIPALLLVLFSAVDIIDTGAGESVDFLTPGSSRSP